MEQHRLQLFVHALGVQPLYQLRHRQLEDFADAEQGGDGDGATGLNLLPVARRESERLVSPEETSATRYHFNIKRMKTMRLTRGTVGCMLLASSEARVDWRPNSPRRVHAGSFIGWRLHKFQVHHVRSGSHAARDFLSNMWGCSNQTHVNPHQVLCLRCGDSSIREVL